MDTVLSCEQSLILDFRKVTRLTCFVLLELGKRGVQGTSRFSVAFLPHGCDMMKLARIGSQCRNLAGSASALLSFFPRHFLVPYHMGDYEQSHMFHSTLPEPLPGVSRYFPIYHSRCIWARLKSNPIFFPYSISLLW